MPSAKIIDSRYNSPWWLPDPHSQTIVPALLSPKPKVTYERFRVWLRDGDFVHVDALPGLINEHDHRPFVLLFHGLEGSSQSHYALALMNRLRQLDFRGAVAHWRGCSGEPNALARSYHSGESEDINDIITWLRGELSAQTPLYIVGVSLGGNALLKWLGEGELHGAAKGLTRDYSMVSGAVSISAPQDLEAGAIMLSRGLSKQYTRNFMSSLIPKSRAKLGRFPMPYDENELRTIKGFHEFDEIVTARLHGFQSAKHYWACSSCKQFLRGISVPTLVINALNDPFLPASVLARAHEASSAVSLEYPRQGGHVGFPTSKGFPAATDWLPQRCLEFFSLV